MPNTLKGKKIAILVADGFEQVELTKPKQALEDAGAETKIVSPADGKVQGMNHDKPADKVSVDVPLSSANANDFDGLHLPGGVMNPDQLRTIPEAVNFVKSFFDNGKPVSAICHGSWTMVEADVVKGRTLTSWPSLKTDLKNAGANWVDREVVRDKNLVTSRKPEDIPAFNREIVSLFAEGSANTQQKKVA